MINKKEFPQTELQEKIREFWSIRGYSKVMAVLGNLNVSFHYDNPKYSQNGLSYQYLEQFWNKAQKEMLELQIKLIEDLGKDNIEIYELKLLLEDFNKK